MKKYGMDWPEPGKDELSPVVILVRRVICKMKQLRAKQVKAGDYLLSIIDFAEVPALLQEIMNDKRVTPEVYSAAAIFSQNKINGTTTVADFAGRLVGSEEAVNTAFLTETFSTSSDEELIANTPSEV